MKNQLEIPTPSPPDTETGEASAASSCSAQLVRLAADMARAANLPEFGDQWEWFKTTPLAERGRVIQICRQTNAMIQGFAVRLLAIQRQIDKPNDQGMP